ncbi:hypothetical protein BT67DRAFT_430483 [Trichocladium antarcticum]|uniref:F-box domain-containing protein n=1 Tax=Trichocladium antarcticum TaxID=1450529 RepID=A0AAN6UC68_9PEZI|nr:hypothetical protein BT67DRAFT_430483 [Trichocladium antarcticum]
MTLTQLPPETIHNIFRLVDPEDLRALARTCRFLHGFTTGNNALCRDIYLRILDTPPTRDLDFVQELDDLVRLRALCSRPDSGSGSDSDSDSDGRTDLPLVHRTVTRLLRHAARGTPALPSAVRPTRSQTYPASRNAALLAGLFSARAARDAFLARSFLFERQRAMAWSVRGVLGVLGVLKDGGGGGEDDDEGDEEGEGDEDDNPRPRQRRRLTSTADAARVVPGSKRQPEKVEEYQASAQLHCLYGCSLSTAPVVLPARLGGRSAAAMRTGAGLYAVACAKVYDLREYSLETLWGPFREGGGEGLRVDWEKVEAILIVLGTNIRNKGLEAWPIFGNFWGRPFAGVWEESYIPWWRGREKEKGEQENGEEAEKGGKESGKKKEKGEKVGLERRDPYGVSGSWLRVVCFLADYSDFFNFNFPHGVPLPADELRPPLNVGGAMRLILLRMRVDKIDPPGEGDHPDYPVVHFVGFSRALDGAWDDNADSDLRGSVRMTPEGAVRWTTYSIFNDEERWKSEGVQLGGLRSARGVAGSWFDKHVSSVLPLDYSPNGPCGPTAFWKVSDRESKGDDPQVTFLEDLLPIIDDAMEAGALGGDGDGLSDEFGEEVYLDGGVDIGFNFVDDVLGDDFDEVDYFDHDDEDEGGDGGGGYEDEDDDDFEVFLS